MMNGEWVDTDKIDRDIRTAALDQLHDARQRIADLEAQLAAAREDIRRGMWAQKDGCPR
jgi:N-methylhydantoinase B/oxoprolinase/acetone carboxylase alpha subunit